jgi:hypothetical protein
MKFKTTLILFAIFVVLLALVYFLEFRSKSREDTGDKLVDLSSEDVEKIVLKEGEEIIQFERAGEDWLITEPLEAKGDKYEINRLADDFSDLRIERVVEEEPSDLEKYGIPQKEVSLFTKDQQQPLTILIGMENPLDKTFFAKRTDELKVVLIPSLFKSLLEKNVFDFRQKDIFKFETDQVQYIDLKSKDIQWEAEKKDEEWFLQKPVHALAKKSDITDVLYSLSNLKAKEFVSEDKKDEEIKKFGLDNPLFKVSVTLPLENQQVTFSVQKKEDTVYATSSLSSKIIQVEDSVLSDLGKTVEEFREKKVSEFYTWEVGKLQIRKADLIFILEKDEEDNWHFEDNQEEADKEKIQSFLRKIEGLEAQEFIDPPIDFQDYDLETPQAEVKIWVGGEDDATKEIFILIGSEDEETKTVYVKNKRFEYLFKVDSDFLEEFPQKKDDWKPPEQEEKEEKNEIQTERIPLTL